MFHHIMFYPSLMECQLQTSQTSSGMNHPGRDDGLKLVDPNDSKILIGWKLHVFYK